MTRIPMPAVRLMHAVLVCTAMAASVGAQIPPTPPASTRPVSPVTPRTPAQPPTPPSARQPAEHFLRGWPGELADAMALTSALAESLAPLRALEASTQELLRPDAYWRSFQFPGDVEFAAQARHATVPPSPSDANDPADSLYREARKALSNDAYRKAADLFRRIRDRYPKSTYTPDAPYWEAFALQRLSTQDDLLAAKAALSWQLKQFPKAATHSDALALGTRIDGALARYGNMAADSVLRSRARLASRDGCPSSNDDERVDALNALIQVDAEAALPILKKVLTRREACTQNLRRTAVWLLASRKVPEAASLLMGVAKNDPDKDVREQAIFWLSNVPTDEAALMLVDLAKGGGDIELRKRAVFALSRSKSPRATATLKEIALDANADADLRGDALQWYMQGPGRQSDDPMSFLKEAYGKADDQSFRSRILAIVAQQRSEASRALLFEIAQNQKESMETRRQVMSYFSMAGIQAEQIGRLYDRTSETELKQQLLASMSMMKDGGIDKLLDVARNEKNIELRKQALAMLGRSKDPRVVQLYQEIINR